MQKKSVYTREFTQNDAHLKFLPLYCYPKMVSRPIRYRDLGLISRMTQNMYVQSLDLSY